MSADTGLRFRARYLPNLLTLLRLLAVPVLTALATRRMETAFAWLLIAALLTDVADGWIARAWSLESQLGARLDSLADTALMFAAVYGIWASKQGVGVRVARSLIADSSFYGLNLDTVAGGSVSHVNRDW